MRKLILAACFLFSFMTIGTSQFHFGAGAQLVLDSPSAFGVQGTALYEVNDSWRGAAAFTFYLDDIYSWALDADAHYTALEIGDGFSLSPFAGLNITSLDIFGLASGTDAGVNLGAFFEFSLGDSMNLYAAPKFTLGGIGSFSVSGGILF